MVVAVLVTAAGVVNAAMNQDTNNMIARDNTGSCGTSLNWTYYAENYTLVIRGTGEMDNFTRSNIPWYEFSSHISSVDIEC